MRPFFIIAALLVLVLGMPPLWLVGSIPPAKALAVLLAPDVAPAVVVSLAASLLALGASVVLGIPAGYALARGRGWWRGPATFAVALPLVFPPIATGVMLLALVGTRTPLGTALGAIGLQIVDRLGGVALAEFFVSAPFIVIAATAAFGEVDVRLEEAARTLGATTLRTFFLVSLPLAAPTISAGVLLGWLRALGEYGATSIVAYHPTSLPVALYIVLSSDGLQRALALAYAFIVFAALVVAAQAALRRRLL